MTYKTAKKTSLEVWRYLVRHPDITRKEQLPKELWRKIDRFINNCAVCEYIVKTKNKASVHLSCKGCPFFDKKRIKEKMTCYLYTKWHWSASDKARKKWAQKIIETIEAWEEK
ncbi:MAG: hypothetical protein LBQ89_08005 [Treponema sp.]|jgi:hypothetical protein|nr:hypothetical protein [Treponema sp.]